MLTKIICQSCGEILRAGEPGATTEYKTCITCVTEAAPASKKVMPEGNALSKTMEETVRRNINNFNEQLKTLHVEMPFKKINDEWCVMVELSDYKKNKLAEWGYSRDKLLEFINIIEELEEEEKAKKK